MTTLQPPITAPSIRQPDLLRSMRRLDLTGNTRIPMVMELVGDLSRAREPNDVFRIYSQGVYRLGGERAYVSLSTRGLAPGEFRITRKILAEQDWDRALQFDPWRNGQMLPVQRGGILGEIIRSAYPELIHNLNLRGDPVLGDELAGFGSLMAIPLFDEGLPVNWAIRLHPDPQGFSLDELEDAILRGNLVGGTIKNTLVSSRLQAANQLIEREVEHVARIQRALLPQELPAITGVTMAAGFETFGTAGGDLYEVVPLQRLPDGRADPNGTVALMIADASGHGPAAAVVIAMLNTLLHAYHGQDGSTPGDVLRFANRHLYRKRLEGMFVTAILAAYEPMTRRLHYARAGHNPALLKHAGAGGAVERLDQVGGVPLGVLADVAYETATVQLRGGLSVVMYTDGIPDARNRDGQAFGVEGIERALEGCSGQAACTVQSIQEAVRAHENGLPSIDDQTILTMAVG